MQRWLRRVPLTMALATMCVVCSPVMAADPYLFEVIKKPAYARALKSLLDHAADLPIWTREALKPRGSLVETIATHAIIDGTTYEVFFNCESQNCHGSQLAVMFAPNGKRAWGAFFQEGKIAYLGTPSEAQQAVLKERLDAHGGN